MTATASWTAEQLWLIAHGVVITSTRPDGARLRGTRHGTEVLRLPLTHRWSGRSYLPDRWGERCRIVIKGRGRAALVEFEDGYRARTEVSLLRRLP